MGRIQKGYLVGFGALLVLWSVQQSHLWCEYAALPCAFGYSCLSH